MWTPTHVQVTVQRSKGLLYKGKNGTNDVFVTIGLGKERYQTSVKERASDPVEWHEECELAIPKQGNKAEIVLTALHRNFIGDDFLGVIHIPLSEFDVYERPSNKWYTLKNKPGKDNTKKRGELEVRVGFTVKAGAATGVGSLSDLSKKEGHRSSIGQFKGGSLFSLGKEKKGLKSFAKAVSHKVSTLPGRGKKKKEEVFGTIPEQHAYDRPNHNRNEADPGIVSDDEDEFRFDELSHKSSHSSLSVSQAAISTPKDGSLENLGGGEFLRQSYATPPKPSRLTTSYSATEEKNLKSGLGGGSVAPIDDWESKLFGKQNSKEIRSSSPSPSKIIPAREPLDLKKETEISKSEITLDIPKSHKPSEPLKEPVPKPRQVQEIRAESKVKASSMEDIYKESKPIKEEKIKKEKHRSSKETFASIFSPSKPKESEDSPNQKGTPVGITNPIRMKESNSETRLPRETIRKFDGKSRDDLIEAIMTLQSTVDQQKQKIGDMEEYLENLLVRVMENKPTLLQSPYVSVRPIK